MELMHETIIQLERRLGAYFPVRLTMLAFAEGVLDTCIFFLMRMGGFLCKIRVYKLVLLIGRDYEIDVECFLGQSISELGDILGLRKQFALYLRVPW